MILYNQPHLSDFFTDPNFPHLEKLALENCLGLKALSISCRLLQEFTLKTLYSIDGLEVSGSKLQRPKVVSCFHLYSEESVVKINTSNLKSVVNNY